MNKSSHGGDIYTFAKKLKTKPEKIVDFSSNINQCSPSISLDFNTLDVSKYADTNYSKLKKSLAKKYQVKTNQIALFNGASSAIQTLIETQQHVTIYAPIYSEYKRYAKDVELIDRFKNLYQEPQKDSFVVFVNPSTPDGKYYDMDELFEIWDRQNNTVLIDESFLDFTPNTSAFRNSNKVYILKSLTKFYSCAGVRVGAIFSHKKNIKKLPSVLWNISALDSEFLKQRLVDEEFMKKSKELHKTQKEELKAILENSSLFDEIVESQTNFILTHTAKGEELFTHLLEHKILVRECQSFTYLDKKWLRFAVKSKEDQQKLEEALSAFS